MTDSDAFAVLVHAPPPVEPSKYLPTLYASSSKTLSIRNVWPAVVVPVLRHSICTKFAVVGAVVV